MPGWLERLRGGSAADDEQDNYLDQDDQQQGGEEGEGDPDVAAGAADDPLAGLDEQTRAVVEELIAQREYETQEGIRQSIGQIGFDIGVDGRPVISDPARLAQFYDQLPGRQPSQQQRQSNNVVQQPEEPEEMPDPYADPAGFATWQRREMEKLVAPIRQENQQLRQQVSRTASATVLPRVGEAVQQYAPWLGELVDLPQFQQGMRDALAGLPPEQYEDPADLARVASMVAVGVQQQAAFRPRMQQPQAGGGQPGLERDPQTGRFRPAGSRPQPNTRLAAREAANRAALAQGGPSRDAGRQARGQEVTELHRRLASLQGISVEEAALLAQDTTGDKAAQLRAKRLNESRGSR